MSDSSPISSHLPSRGFQVGLLKAGQIGDVARVLFSDSWRCCPIGPQEIADINLHSDCREHDSRETGVASVPSRQEAHVSHNEMHDGRRPDLSPKSRQRASISRPPESWRDAGEPFPQGPVEPLGYDGISVAVRIREGVASGWQNAVDAGEFGSVYCGVVDELVEAECMQEVPEHQRVELGTVRELTRSDGLVVGDPVDQVSGEPLDNFARTERK